MSAVTSASARWVLLWLSLVMWTEAKDITAEPGENVTLTCETTLNNNIIVVKWIRPDQEKERYVLLYRDGQIDTDSQLPSFKGRVSLPDKWMKAGNVSVILENVTKDDSGTYECQVKQEGTSRRKRSAETKPISTIKLTVEPAGRGHVVAGVVVAVVAIIAVVVLVMSKRSQVNSSTISTPSEVMLV